MKLLPKGALFVISAPSGAGKTTIAHAVLSKVNTFFPLSRVITYTTRPARSTEKDGVDYNFVTQQDFLAKKASNFFLETTNYDGHWYGSPSSIYSDLSANRSLLIVTDQAGAKTFKKLIPEALLIWIDVPNINVISERLVKRGTGSTEDTQRRTSIARKEIEQEKQEHFFDHHVMNDTLDNSISQVVGIILNDLKKSQALGKSES